MNLFQILYNKNTFYFVHYLYLIIKYFTMTVKQIISKWKMIGCLDGLNDIQSLNVSRSLEFTLVKFQNQINDDNLNINIFVILRKIVSKIEKIKSKKNIEFISNNITNKFKIWYSDERLKQQNLEFPPWN